MDAINQVNPIYDNGVEQIHRVFGTPHPIPVASPKNPDPLRVFAAPGYGIHS